MHQLFLPILVFTIAFVTNSGNVSRADSKSKTLYEFDTDYDKSWQVVNDGVMGGRSRGYVAFEDGILKFTGTLVTQGGGFTSVRTDRAVDLEAYAGVELRVRGNGRTFEVEVSDGTRLGGRSVSRRASFETTEEWALVRVPFGALKATVFGEPVNVAPIELSKARRFGLYILDGKDGPFSLEVDFIRAYVADAD